MLFLIYFTFIAVVKSARGDNIFSPKIIFDNAGEVGNSDFGSCPLWSNKVPNKIQIPPDDLNGSGDIERLVVYLYRNKITENIHLFTPKKKSQYCFPDLGTDDEGDSMLLDSDELYKLLDSNPNIIAIPSSDNIDKGIVISPYDEHLSSSITEEDDDFDEDEDEYQFSEETSIIKNPSDNPYDEDILPISPFDVSDFVDKEKVSDFTDLQEPTLNTPKQHGNDWTDEGIVNIAGQDIFLPLRALLGKQITFDEWFIRQMRRFVGERFNKNLNVRMLKSTIQKILHDNSIFIRNDGVLIDHGGMVINPSNLNLRPILIGDSVAYKKILSLRDSTFVSLFPSNSPYLDTLVVSQVFPPRLLGIIPLGKTFIPKRSRSRIINHEHRQPENKFTRATVPFPEDETNAHLVSKKRNVGNEHVLTTKKQRRPPDEKETNASEIASRNAPNIFGLLNTFKSLNGQGFEKIIEPFLDSIQPSEKNYYKHEHPPLSEYEDLEMDDDLGFKIIGGNAATSSGTPISSKGRSSNFFDFFN